MFNPKFLAESFLFAMVVWERVHKRWSLPIWYQHFCQGGAWKVSNAIQHSYLLHVGVVQNPATLLFTPKQPLNSWTFIKAPTKMQKSHIEELGRTDTNPEKPSPHDFTYPLVICYIAIENSHNGHSRFPIKNGGSFHSYVIVYQRVIKEAKK